MHKTRFYFFLAVTALLTMLLPSSAWADTVYTRDHRVWHGLIVAENTRQVWLDLGFDVAVLNKEKILRIRRSDPKTIRLLSENLKARRKRRSQLLFIRSKKPAEVPLAVYAGHVVVDTILNGRVKARLLLDTGSTFTFLSPAIAAELGIPRDNNGRTAEVLTSDGRTQRMLVTSLESVRVGTAEARDVQVAVLPQTKEKIPFADGLLGVSYLSHFNFKIDYGQNKLILEPNGSAGLSKDYNLSPYRKK